MLGLVRALLNTVTVLLKLATEPIRLITVPFRSPRRSQFEIRIAAFLS